jgi:hypothetical protein
MKRILTAVALAAAVTSCTVGTVAPSKSALAKAAESCLATQYLDTTGNWSWGTNSSATVIEEIPSCMMATVAGEAVERQLLNSTASTGPVSVTTNGYTLTFSYNGVSGDESLTIIKAP